MFGNLDFSCQGCFDIWIMNINTNHRADHIKNKDIHPTALWRPFHICFAAHGYVRLLTVPWIFLPSAETYGSDWRLRLFHWEPQVEITAEDDEAGGVYWSSPQSVIVIFLEVLPDREPKVSTFLTTSSPSFTLPKTTCLPSSLNEKQTNVIITAPWSETIHAEFKVHLFVKLCFYFCRWFLKRL